MYQMKIDTTTQHFIGTRDPSIWGPSFWLFLHSMSANYPDNPTPKVSNNMKQFITSIPLVLPCEFCAKHCEQFINRPFVNLNDVCSSKNKLFSFFYHLHNNVNLINNKALAPYWEVRGKYFND